MPKIRFSLASVLCLATILAMGLAILRFQSELVPLREEVLRLRGEAGNLTIEDSKRLHAIRLRTEDDLSWKWKVHLPKGKTFFLYSYVGKWPEQNVLPTQRDGAYRISSPWLSDGSPLPPQTISVSVGRDINGALVLRQRFGEGVAVNPLSEDQQKPFIANAGGSKLKRVEYSTSAMVDGKPLELLREIRADQSSLDQGEKTETDIIVWLEELENR